MPLTFKEQPREMVGMDEWHLSSCVKLRHDPVFTSCSLAFSSSGLEIVSSATEPQGRNEG